LETTSWSDSVTESLSERLRDLRTQAGLTQTALAKPRYTVSYVSQIEAGRRTPSPDAMAFFASRLAVSPHFLATGMPEDIEDHLRYDLERVRTELRAGNAEEAEQIVEKVLAQAERYDLREITWIALVSKGELLLLQDRVLEAIDAFEQALEGDLPEHEQARAAVGLARTYRTTGDLQYAASVLEAFLQRGDRGPLDPRAVADIESILVSIYFERGDITRAERAGRRALEAASLGRDLKVRAEVYWSFSRILAERKKWDEAREYSTRARVLSEELEDFRSVARLHNAYAFICLESDPPRLDDAAYHLDEAEQMLSEHGSVSDLAYLHTERSRLALMRGHPEDALAFAEKALGLTGSDQLKGARCLFLMGRAFTEAGRTQEAGETLERAAAVFNRHGARQQEAACWRELGKLALAEGDQDRAIRSLLAGLEALDPSRSRA
jgi:tetratricopeptide (TPR) repeat protein